MPSAAAALTASTSSPGAGPSSPPKTFRRIRSTLEHSLRGGSKSKPKVSQPLNEHFAANVAHHKHINSDATAVEYIEPMKDKGKQRVAVDVLQVDTEKKDRSIFSLKRRESKAILKQQATREQQIIQSLEHVSTTGGFSNTRDDNEKKKSKPTADDQNVSKISKSAAYTPFDPPALSRASMSSPALKDETFPPPPPIPPAKSIKSVDAFAAGLAVIARARKISTSNSRANTSVGTSSVPPETNSAGDKTSSRSRTSLPSPTSPTFVSSPSLLPSPTSSQRSGISISSPLPLTSSTRTRPRPSPLQSTSPVSYQPTTRLESTPFVLPVHSQSETHIQRDQRETASPSPTLLPRSLSTPSPPNAARPSRLPSRPPLSPSAASTAGLKSKMRSMSASTNNLPLESMSLPISDTPPERPEKAARRRSSGGVVQPSATGRTSPSTNRVKPTASVPSSPTRMSPSPLHMYRRHHGSASTTVLPVVSAVPQTTSRTRSPSIQQSRLRSPSPQQVSSRPSSRPSSTSTTMRDTIRHASSVLIRELGGPKPRPPSGVNTTYSPGCSPIEIWEECEVRLRALIRFQRVWGSSAPAANTSTTSVNSVTPTATGSSLTQAGEDRERRVFSEAVRDGYVLCQFVNKLKPTTIVRIDAKEDGFVRTSNVTKCLAAATTLGVPASELFHRDDLLECTSEGLLRVARTIIALLRIAGDNPPIPPSKHIYGLGPGGIGLGHPSSSPYNSPSKASSSTPNIPLSSQSKRSSSPIASKPQLPPLRSESPAEKDSTNDKSLSVSDKSQSTVAEANEDKKRPMATANDSSVGSDESDAFFESNERFIDSHGSSEVSISPLVQPPRRERVNTMTTTATTTSGPSRETRTSFASGSSQTTNTTGFSSLLSPSSGMSVAGERTTNFGTIRTVATEATSFASSDEPSLFRSEASSVAASAPTVSAMPADERKQRRRSLDAPRSDSGSLNFESQSPKILFPIRDRRPSETAVIDLSRVIEEAEEGTLHPHAVKPIAESSEEATKQSRQSIQLGKGKWPDDFISAFSAPEPSSPIPIKPINSDQQATSPLKFIPASPPKVVPSNDESGRELSSESPSQLQPRRPLHRSRHSVDSAGLLPKDAILGRDPSPDASGQTTRVVPRRNSTKSNANRNGMYIPRTSSQSPSPDSGTRVPFPRTTSEQYPTNLPPEPASAGVPGKFAYRGRFQSEIDDSSRRKPRPNSFDELSTKPRRSRYESMVNLGGSAKNASASDLLRRDSIDSTVRHTLIVREDGKSPTHFQLGNCIGRGQFGSVYRALNLNTGQMVAVKRIRLEGLSEQDVKQLMKEVDLVKRLSHPSIVKYEGMVRDADTLNIVLEYAENGSLGQILKSFGKLNEKLVASYVVKILEGLDYLHRSDVVHCDLKAANILTTKNGNVKLSDFGVSLNLHQIQRETRNEVAGTPNWMAPEIIELKGPSTASDIWSLACTVIELLNGKPPYSDKENGMSVMFHIVEDDMPPIPEEFSESLKDFLRQCFQKDPSKRPSAEELCEHEWLKNNWGNFKDLQGRDSIPFLRRVSADLQKSELARLLPALAALDAPRADSQMSDRPLRYSGDISSTPASPVKTKPSIVLPSPPPKRPDSDPALPLDHVFVKTTLHKPITCRVCMETVKKTAVLCENCNLIAHARCAENAPPTCALRTQLLQYAHYATNGRTMSAQDIMAVHQQFSAPPSTAGDTSVPDAGTLGNENNNANPKAPPPLHPPTAFKMFGAFRRSKTSLSGEYNKNEQLLLLLPGSSRNSSGMDDEGSQQGSGADEAPRKRKPSVLKRPREARTTSFGSSGHEGTPNKSSLRSALTSRVGEAESASVSSASNANILSGGRKGVKSILSVAATDGAWTEGGGSVRKSRLSVSVVSDPDRDRELVNDSEDGRRSRRVSTTYTAVTSANTNDYEAENESESGVLSREGGMSRAEEMSAAHEKSRSRRARARQNQQGSGDNSIGSGSGGGSARRSSRSSKSNTNGNCTVQ